MQRVSAAIATLVALTTVGACGSDSDSTAGFCDGLSAIEQNLELLQQGEPEQMDNVVEALQAIDPPDKIADAYGNVIDVYQSMDDEQSITDPAFATKFADVSADISEVRTYITEHCTTEDRDNS